jgi:hypothetical protein
MPSLSQFSGQSIPSSAGALERQNEAKLERKQKRDCNPIDNVLVLTLGFTAIAAIIWGIIHLSKKKDNRVIDEECEENEEEVTEETLENDAMASIAGGLKRSVTRAFKRDESELEIVDSEKFMRFLRDKLD